ncbi:SurA N-terminal domain-containing protein [Halobacillus salinarum]|uniref:SurA N-terminal domain-containing protein n=1 Tax=Halobacillus salinarum TaxID=2932257 RepID=A0ABY4EH66_9BACI|nr:SurA N-terminal domain-containing protein [Halobacillus salinarum]UOQ42797.1 SurA N-terminal domain-containing protein [Halobacillus salinarum]
MRKLFLMLMIAALAAFGLSACSDKESAKDDSKQTEKKQESSDASAEENSSGPVAVVNGEELPRQDFNTQFESMKQQYQQMGMDVEKNKDKLKQSVVDQMIGAELLSQQAEEDGIKVSTKEVDKKYTSFTDQFKSKDQMKQAYEKNDLSEKKVKNQLEENIKITKYIDENTDKPKVSEDELKKQYETMTKGKKDAPKFEEVKPTLKKQLEQQKTQKQVQSLVDKLRKDADVEVKI